jgi:tetratricopeptide (TPR) repeat protein
MDAAKLSREVMVLNNESVIYLQMSNPLEAYKLLTQASSLLSKLLESPAARSEKTSTHKQCQYDWVDFSEPMSRNRLFLQDKDWDSQGGIPYLFLLALKISTPASSVLYEHISSRGPEDNDNSDGEEDDDAFYDSIDEDAAWDDSSCRDGDDSVYYSYYPSCVAWVVYFNLAITCNILASEKARGETGRLCYLKQAYHMYEATRGLIEDLGPSKDMSTLLMAVFNNQSCAYHEYAMYDESIACMERVKELLARTPYKYRDIGSDCWQVFSLNLLLLLKPTLASAA